MTPVCILVDNLCRGSDTVKTFAQLPGFSFETALLTTMIPDLTFCKPTEPAPGGHDEGLLAAGAVHGPAWTIAAVAAEHFTTKPESQGGNG